MKYYKIENGNKTYAGSSIIVDDKQVINPTSEILLAAGYTAESEEFTDAELLQDAIVKKLQEITDYDNSQNVNAFTYNGITAWFDADERKSYEQSILSCETLGITTINVPISGSVVTMNVADAKVMLAKIHLYADACYLVTMQHKQQVSKLSSVTDVEAFDITKDYPTKLAF
jgi:hypothetical protein